MEGLLYFCIPEGKYLKRGPLIFLLPLGLQPFMQSFYRDFFIDCDTVSPRGKELISPLPLIHQPRLAIIHSRSQSSTVTLTFSRRPERLVHHIKNRLHLLPLRPASI